MGLRYTTIYTFLLYVYMYDVRVYILLEHGLYWNHDENGGPFERRCDAAPNASAQGTWHAPGPAAHSSRTWRHRRPDNAGSSRSTWVETQMTQLLLFNENDLLKDL